MKFTPMERADKLGGVPPEEKARHAVAFGVALTVHAAALALLSFVPQKPLNDPVVPISVKLVVVEAAPLSFDIAEKKPPEVQTIEPEPDLNRPDTSSPEPQPSPTPEPPTENSTVEILPSPASSPPTSVPLSILSTQDSQSGDPIPDKWRLPDGASIPLDKTKQPRNPNFEALIRALDCLGFEADCATQRKTLFAEDQLSGTDLVWMPSHAHSGLSNSDFYGMSEAQIRERLGVPTAGKNGFMILPGIAIDGPWWDALHGVNKACDYGLGVNDLGQKQLMKRCKPLKPTSRDRIGFIPMPTE